MLASTRRHLRRHLKAAEAASTVVTQAQVGMKRRLVTTSPARMTARARTVRAARTAT
jgi:hypothetical protein